ncbi:hypothetical protein KL86PLE_30288 [uncultured Pleomorphomonas sp.]|uniref:Uncharacterized protein n=1 Tax=uncultured Pleomorphomonas sp. TaxID=442121 RepID=A0A212LE70_9HYPH|nr:hypothetical protein [Pleomorphomonas carboxyditropha]SCM75841.1 hypothetical protein KL86PLE_30288 [uncultured Pleomorphomonas sp.]
MEEKALTLRHELPGLIEAAKALEASVLVMLLTTVDEELRKQDKERRHPPGRESTDRP